MPCLCTAPLFHRLQKCERLTVSAYYIALLTPIDSSVFTTDFCNAINYYSVPPQQPQPQPPEQHAPEQQQQPQPPEQQRQQDIGVAVPEATEPHAASQDLDICVLSAAFQEFIRVRMEAAAQVDYLAMGQLFQAPLGMCPACAATPAGGGPEGAAASALVGDAAARNGKGRYQRSSRGRCRHLDGRGGWRGGSGRCWCPGGGSRRCGSIGPPVP